MVAAVDALAALEADLTVESDGRPLACVHPRLSSVDRRRLCNEKTQKRFLNSTPQMRKLRHVLHATSRMTYAIIRFRNGLILTSEYEESILLYHFRHW